MSYHIDDERKWRISKSGFSIKTGLGGETRVVAAYPGVPGAIASAIFSKHRFQECAPASSSQRSNLAPSKLGAVPDEGRSNAAHWYTKWKESEERCCQFRDALNELSNVLGTSSEDL